MRNKVIPDKEKAKALIKMADDLFERLNRFDIEEFPTPNLNDLYDIIHMLLDAYFIRQGIKFKEKGAYFELIEEAKKINLISEKEKILLQQIRGMRNRYKYEGFCVSKDFLIRNKNTIITIIKNLKSILHKI